jgi:DDE family transposase
MLDQIGRQRCQTIIVIHRKAVFDRHILTLDKTRFLQALAERSDEIRPCGGRPEHILDEVQRRLDEHPEKMRQRRETVEHPFGTIKARMGATHFLMKTLPKVASEMALHVLAYNLTRVMNIMGVQPLLAAMQA